jgi:hypothetical protein
MAPGESSATSRRPAPLETVPTTRRADAVRTPLTGRCMFGRDGPTRAWPPCGAPLRCARRARLPRVRGARVPGTGRAGAARLAVPRALDRSGHPGSGHAGARARAAPRGAVDQGVRARLRAHADQELRDVRRARQAARRLRDERLGSARFPWEKVAVPDRGVGALPRVVRSGRRAPVRGRAREGGARRRRARGHGVLDARVVQRSGAVEHAAAGAVGARRPRRRRASTSRSTPRCTCRGNRPSTRASRSTCRTG